MSLKYTKYEDLCLKAGSKITLNALNEAFRKLVENDVSLIPENSIVPKIWECRWFADKNAEGYKKGEAVWLNTEPLDEFTASRYQTILNYMLQDSYYRPKVEALQADNDVERLFLLCKSMVANGKIFYVGDLEKPVQIKISLEDNNKDLPLDTSSKWKDFFINTDDDTNMQTFQKVLVQQTQELLDLHQKTYHLPESFPVNQYLLRDLSNLDQAALQRCKSTKYRSNYSGFDYVLLSARKKYAGRSEKWFRIWSSGYIEHGGTIDLDASLPQGDSIEGSMYKVNLAWRYGKDGSSIAPTYEYQPIDFRDLYCIELSSDFEADGEEVAVKYDLEDMVSTKTRYVISLTPVMSKSSFPYMQPPGYPQTLDLYETNSVCAIDNGSFMFYFQSKDTQDGNAARCYSYSCYGFSTTMFDRARKAIQQPQDQTFACECR